MVEFDFVNMFPERTSLSFTYIFCSILAVCGPFDPVPVSCSLTGELAVDRIL